MADRALLKNGLDVHVDTELKLVRRLFTKRRDVLKKTVHTIAPAALELTISDSVLACECSSSPMWPSIVASPLWPSITGVVYR